MAPAYLAPKRPMFRRPLSARRRHDRGKRREARWRSIPNPTVAWSKVSLAASLSAPSPTPRRHRRARLKLEIPIDPRRNPAGSCLGGFRTPHGIRKPSPKLPFSRWSGKLQSERTRVGPERTGSPAKIPYFASPASTIVIEPTGGLLHVGGGRCLSSGALSALPSLLS